MLTTTPFDLGPKPAAPVPPGAPPTNAAGGAAPDFARALTDLLTATAPAALAARTGTERHVTAATGKTVPVAPLLVAAPPVDCELPDPDLLPTAEDDVVPTANADDSADLPEPSLEPALAWLLLPPPVPAPRPGLPVATAIVSRPDGEQSAATPVERPAAPLRAPPTAVDCEMPANPPEMGTDISMPILAPVPEGLPRPASTGARWPVPDQPIAPVAATGSSQPAPAIAEPEPTPGAPRVTAASPTIVHALAAVATREIRLDPPTPPRTVHFDPSAALRNAIVAIGPAESSAPAAIALADGSLFAIGAPATSQTVAPTGSAQQTGIDLTRDPGLHRMIDRIEQLRDAADGRETRIRLIPDALGPVDIAVRREGEGVRVHFTATEAATRQLIVDAQPRLTELAEARGVRIERASVDGGGRSWNGDGQARPQPQPTQPLPRVPARAGRDPAESIDERIA